MLQSKYSQAKYVALPVVKTGYYSLERTLHGLDGALSQ